MSDDPFLYQQWIENALRSVVRKALREVEENGIGGSHHFYVTFRTDAEDVDMPDWLRERYPEEITIVLQHEFWDLKVEDERFFVALSFNDIRCSLEVPFSAIISFADPAVKFGLQFQTVDIDEDDAEIENFEPIADNGAPAISMAPADEDVAKTGEVIALDSFRKK